MSTVQYMNTSLLVSSQLELVVSVSGSAAVVVVKSEIMILLQVMGSVMELFICNSQNF